MSSAILYSVEDQYLATPRPDSFWCELVRNFVPNKSKETGDSDPYGAGTIELNPDHAAQLRGMVEAWPEIYPLWQIVDGGATVWVHREP